MNVQARLPEHERLRLLELMGVDVYALRGAPLARANVPAATPSKPLASPEHRAAPRVMPVAPVVARVRIDGVGGDEHPLLLAAVMRSARLRSGEWTIANVAGDTLPVWRFGAVTRAGAASPSMELPELAELRDSVRARRDAWLRLRTWLRRA